MPMRRTIAGLFALGALFGAFSVAHAAPLPSTSMDVGVCDPRSPQNCIKPNSSGAIPITGSITATNPSVGTNNAAAPTSSTQIGTLDGSGNLQPASAANPVPVTGSFASGYTAEATATSVAAGTNKPGSIDTANKAQRVEVCVPGSTTCIDLSGGTLGTNGGAVSTVQGGAGMIPLDTNIKQIAGAVPSLTNPIWIANAEAADTTGTFTNATQTASVTNSTADGYAGGLISINGTYGTASGVFEASDDAGTTFYSVICARSDGSAQETGYTSLTNTNRQWSCPVGGNDSFRVRSTAVASGTVNVRVGVSAPPPEALGGTGGGVVTQPTAANLNAQVQGPGASGASLSGNPVRIGCGFTTGLITVTTGQTADVQCDAKGGMFSTQEQAGVAQLWFGTVPTSAIGQSATVNTPVENAITRVYNSALNGYVGIVDAGGTSNGTGANVLGATLLPAPSAVSAIPPVVSTTLESCHVLKNSAGNLFNISVTIQAVSGVLSVFNLTAPPSAGAVTPIWSQAVISNGTFGSGAWAWPAGAPLRGSTGLVACFSSATTPFTYTSSATAMISAGVL